MEGCAGPFGFVQTLPDTRLYRLPVSLCAIGPVEAFAENGLIMLYGANRKPVSPSSIGFRATELFRGLFNHEDMQPELLHAALGVGQLKITILAPLDWPTADTPVRDCLIGAYAVGTRRRPLGASLKSRGNVRTVTNLDGIPIRITEEVQVRGQMIRVPAVLTART